MFVVHDWMFIRDTFDLIYLKHDRFICLHISDLFVLKQGFLHNIIGYIIKNYKLWKVIV